MNSMTLLDILEMELNISVLKDASFNALGMVTTKFEDELALTFIENEKYIEALVENKSITAVITTESIALELINKINIGIIVSTSPKKSFYELHNKLVEKNFYHNKFDSVISASAIISNQVYISEECVIIGDNTFIEPNVTIHSGSIIGSNVIIRSGTQIGSAGFQFLNVDETVFSVKSGGMVEIKDNVEIQHNCCIDKGVFGGKTILESYVKVDNLVHVAHDCIIGERTFLTACVILSGRVSIGKDCWLGPNSTIANGIIIGENVKVSLGAVVTKNIGSGKIVSGNFAIDHSKFLEFIKSIR